MTLTRELMLDRMQQRDAAFDGRFITGVLSTGIYCLPSCRARNPKPENVRFFQHPDAAEASGLRACKRCRPDLFYRGEDPDGGLVAGLVERLRTDPAAFRKVGDLVAASGVGASKLKALFRRYYHATPAEMLARARVDRACRELLDSDQGVAEIAFDVGWETLSAFNDGFRRRVGMSPQRYRALAKGEPFAIDLPGWLSRERLLTYLGREPLGPTHRREGSHVRFVLEVAGIDILATAELRPRRAACRFEAATLTPQTGPAVHARLLRLLGLGCDPTPFERQLRRDGELVRLVDGQRGLTVPQTADLVDGLVWVIVGQQVSLAVAFNLRARLAQSFGRPLGDGFALLPELETVAHLDYVELQAIGFSRRKAEYLIDLARTVVDGELDLETLAGATAPEIEKRLLAVRGLGPWSVHYLMMRSFGLADCVPLGDVALAESLRRFFELEERPSKASTLELMEPFAPHRSLATFHLWHRLGNAQ